MTSLRDLTSRQIRMLWRLDREGEAPGDHVGRPVGDLKDWELIATYELAQLGLVEIAAGWRGTVWARLTEAGRAMRG